MSKLKKTAYEVGNRFGRPPGTKNYKTIVQEIARETHWVKENGKRTRRSTVELILLKLRNLAMEGNVRACRTYKDILSKYAHYDSGPTGGYLLVSEQLKPEEFVKEALRVRDPQAKMIAEFNKAEADRFAQMKRPGKKPD